MRPPAAKVLLALGGMILACCARHAHQAPAERDAVRVPPPSAAPPRSEAPFPPHPPDGADPRRTTWTAELDAVSRLPEGGVRETRFARLLAATLPENYPALGHRIAACSRDADWRAEAGAFVAAWCAHSPLEAAAWLLQAGSGLDTTTAAQAARSLAVENPDELVLLLDFAPKNWSEDCLLAAAADSLLAQSPDAALRWLSQLRDDAPYRAAAINAIAAECARRPPKDD